MSSHTSEPKIQSSSDLAKISLAALGVVYGDIGTSPLYSIRECFTLPHGVEVSTENILGVESLFFWSLTIVIVVKYLVFIMRADNRGEGGILALLALLKSATEKSPKANLGLYAILALFGTALLYGDGMITPAITVLGAMEGLNTTSEFFSRTTIMILSIVVLLAVFRAQKAGTAKIGAIFGPAILVWFVVIGAIGAYWIAKNPAILLAVNPWYAVTFFSKHQVHGFLLLGFVFLCVTGGEALYADMGHFGKKPIRLAWFVVVFPALIANYLGQGAYLLTTHSVRNPFFEMVSGPARYGLIGLATVAAIIASQAMISGAFSITQQAIQLGYLPRMTIRHTSGQAEGQIYVPEVNFALTVGCVALVLFFKDSSRFASAYGIAVTGTMSITSILFYGVTRTWGWSSLKSTLVTGLFLLVDLSFFGANIHKIADGGWVPLVIGAGMFTLMVTWQKGREVLRQTMFAASLPTELFMEDVKRVNPPRIAGTAVFMTSKPDGIPNVLLHYFKHNKVLHEQVLLLSIETHHVPEFPSSETVEEISDLGEGFYRVRTKFGFMQTPNVMTLMDECAAKGLETRLTETSFFLGRETLVPSDKKSMFQWQKTLFVLMSRNARPANAFFQIPPNRVFEIGAQIEL